MRRWLLVRPVVEVAKVDVALRAPVTRKGIVLIGTSSYFLISTLFDLILFYIFYTLLGSIAVLGLLAVLFRVGALIAYITIPPLLDVLGVKRSYVVLLVFDSALYLAFMAVAWLWGLGLHVLPLLFVLSVSGALIVLVFESLLPEMFSERDLIKANAVSRVFRFALAPLVVVVGGFIADLLGHLEVLVVTCLLLSLNSLMVALATLGVEIAHPRGIGGSHALNIDILLGGFKFIVESKPVLKLMIYSGTAGITVGLIVNLYPVAIARATLGDEAFYFTLIIAIISVAYGAGVSATVVAYRFLRMRYTGFLAVMLVTLSILTLALSLLITLRYPLLVLVDIALISFTSGVYDNILVYLYQTNVPLEVRARVFGVRYLLMILTSIAGFSVGGWMADAMSLNTSIAILSILPLTAGILSLLDGDLRSLDIRAGQTPPFKVE
jgi:MFS family permease